MRRRLLEQCPAIRQHDRARCVGLHPVEFIEEGDSGATFLRLKWCKASLRCSPARTIPVIATNDVPLLQTSDAHEEQDTPMGLAIRN